MQFARRHPPPGPFDNYRRFKPYLREDFRFQCAYCNISEGYRKGSDVFGIDHFRPKALFPDLELTYKNLYYCCAICNSVKGQRFPNAAMIANGTCFLDPCAVDPFAGDCREQGDGHLTGISPSGGFTIEAISLNRGECVLIRRRRLRTAERIRALWSEIAQLSPGQSGRLLAERDLNDAQADWDECYGSYPRSPAK